MLYKSKSIFALKSLVLLAGLLAAATAVAEPAAVVGGKIITREALEQHVKGKLFKLENERYEILRAGLDELVGEQLIALAAEAQGQTPEQFMASEVEVKAAQPNAELVKEVYDANKTHFANMPLEEAMDEVKAYLVEQSVRERYQLVIAALGKQYGSRINLLPPMVEVDAGGRPSLGAASAPITLIEFSDYECSYCKKAELVVKEILETYGDQIRFVYRDFPLDFHKNARSASHAVRCAEQQGQFWAYHERLMASEDLGEVYYRAIAAEVGLDRAQFDRCLASEDFTAAIDRDIAAGRAVGVSGTPAFFINGRMLSGAQPFVKFKQVVDAELERIAGQ